MLLSKIRITFVGSVIALIFLAAGTAVSQTPEDEPETVFTEEIKLNVSAFDDRGKFVSEVNKNDIVIVEDGRLHQPSSIRRLPANVLIVLDTGGEIKHVKSIQQTRKTAMNLVNSLTDQDSIAVLEYHDKAKIILEWTSDKTAVRNALRNDLSFGKRAVLLDALQLATEFLTKSKNENRHLVLISDGTDSFDRSGERANEMIRLMATNINVHVISYTQLEIEKVTKKTKRAGVPAHKDPLPDEVAAGLPDAVRRTNRAPKFGTVNLDKKMLRVMRKRKTDLQAGEKYMQTLTENTSGMFILPETQEEMAEKARLVAKIIDSNYVVTYTPKRPLSESPDGEIRNIEVSSRKSGLRVTARRKLVVKNKPS